MRESRQAVVSLPRGREGAVGSILPQLLATDSMTLNISLQECLSNLYTFV